MHQPCMNCVITDVRNANVTVTVTWITANVTWKVENVSVRTILKVHTANGVVLTTQATLETATSATINVKPEAY